MSLFESMVSLNAKTNIVPLHEVLTGEQYQELFKEAGFGLEFELGAVNDTKVASACSKITGSTSYINLITAMKTLHQLFTTDPSTFFKRVKEAETASGLTGFASGASTFFDAVRNLKFYDSWYGAHDSFTGWKIAPDSSVRSRGGNNSLTMEFITPMGEAKRGLTYDQCIKQIPDIVQALMKMGLHGNTTTGLHLNISVGDKLNRSAVETLLRQLTPKYNPFALVSYFTTRESDGLFQKGAYTRKDNHFCATVDSKIHEYAHSSRGVGDETMGVWLPKILTKLIPEGSQGLEYVVRVPAYLFATAKTVAEFPLGFRWLGTVGKTYLDQLHEEKYVDINASHGNRVELRGFGGARAVDQTKSAQTLGEVLRLGLAQVYPFMDATLVNFQSIFRATSIMLRETLVPALNNYVVSGKLERNLRQTPEVDFCYKQNKCLGFELDTSIREFAITVTDKGRAYAKAPDDSTKVNVNIDVYITKFQDAFTAVKQANPQLMKTPNTPEATAHVIQEFAKKLKRVHLAYPDEHAMQIILHKHGMKETSQYLLNYTPDMVKNIMPKLPVEQEIVLTAPLVITTQPAHNAPVAIEDPSVDLNIVHDPNEKTITIGTGSNRKCFYFNQIKLPVIKDGVVAFHYEDGFRWKVKPATAEEAKNLFDIIASYVALPRRGEVTALRQANGMFRYRWVA